MRRAFSWFLATILFWLVFAPAALAVDPEQNAIPICTVYSLNRGCFRGKTTPDINSRAYVRDGQDGATAGTTCGGLGTTLNLCKFIGTKWIVESVGGAGSGTTLTDSASLSSALSDETGTGAAVFGTGPTITSLPSAVNPGDALGLGDPSLVSAATLLHADGSVTATASQPFGGFKATGLGNGTLGAAETVSMKQLLNGPRAGAAPNGFTFQNCSSGGVCPDPYGMLFIDIFPATASNPGGVHDTNGTLWGLDPGSGPCSPGTPGTACADALDDAIRTTDLTQSFTFAASIPQFAIAVASALPASTSTSTLDGQFCRDNVTFAVCTTGATCVSTFGATGQVADTIVARKSVSMAACTSAGVPSANCTGSGTGYRYFPATIQNYSGCNSASAATFDAWHGFGAAMTTSDTFQRAWFDGTHPGPYMSGLIAQMIAEAKWESAFRGKANLVTNGDMETDCATSGWHVWNATDYTTTTNMATAAWSGTRINPASGVSGGVNGGAYGSACNLSSARAAGTGLVSDLITVDPYKWYQFSFYASVPGATTGNALSIDIIDNAAAGSAASVTAASGATNDLKVWEYDGGDFYALSGTPPAVNLVTSTTNQCYGTCYFVGKVYTRDNSQIRIKVYTQGATDHGTLKLDEVRMAPAVFQNASLNNVFPDSYQTWTLDGDSRSVEAQTNFPSQLDAVFGAIRPGIYLNGTFAANTRGQSGYRANELAAEGATWTVNRAPNYGLIQLGINDLASGTSTTTAALRTSWITIKGLLKAKGIIPVLIGEYPYRSNTTTTSCNSGTINCGKKAFDAMQLLFTNNDLN